ncbi:MAG: hypothetical protein H0V82_10360 [Candidatus Protochlamydia sp.]|nr:hypothetical protein [Candidatus Protochlamydia sp.]
MADPISNQVFSHDYVKYIYQEPDVRITHHTVMPAKPFELNPPEKSKKNKKDLGKNKEQDSSERKKSIFEQ